MGEVISSSTSFFTLTASYWENRRQTIRREIESSKALASVSSGKARSDRQLITYTIASIRDMHVEVVSAERNIALSKKSMKRGWKKARAVEAVEDDDEFPLAVVEEETAFPDSLDSFDSFS